MCLSRGGGASRGQVPPSTRLGGSAGPPLALRNLAVEPRAFVSHIKCEASSACLLQPRFGENNVDRTPTSTTTPPLPPSLSNRPGQNLQGSCQTKFDTGSSGNDITDSACVHTVMSSCFLRVQQHFHALHSCVIASFFCLHNPHGSRVARLV